MIRAQCAHHREVKIVLYSIWYRHTYRYSSRAQSSLSLCTGRPPTFLMIPVLCNKILISRCWEYSARNM